MQKGELIVIGKNHYEVGLDKFPAKVEVKFKKEEHDTVPCNPGDEDSLEYEVHASNHHHSKLMLLIKWSVSSVREIVWEVFY
jgi:hypothetical protein